MIFFVLFGNVLTYKQILSIHNWFAGYFYVCEIGGVSALFPWGHRISTLVNRKSTSGFVGIRGLSF